MKCWLQAFSLAGPILLAQVMKFSLWMREIMCISCSHIFLSWSQDWNSAWETACLCISWACTLQFIALAFADRISFSFVTKEIKSPMGSFDDLIPCAIADAPNRATNPTKKCKFFVLKPPCLEKIKTEKNYKIIIVYFY